jgi:hypothetical protein
LSAGSPSAACAPTCCRARSILLFIVYVALIFSP